MIETTDLVKSENLDIETALGIERALVKHFAGDGPKGALLDAEENCSSSTYYRWKKEHGDLVEAIEDVARFKALKIQRGEDVAYEAKQKRESREIQDAAREILANPDVYTAMAHIVLGGHRTINVGDEERHIVAYPRDQIEALRRIQELARTGALPDHKGDTLQFLDRLTTAEEEERGREENRATLDDFRLGAGIPTQFTKMTVETADGRKIVTEVTDNSDIVEGEVNEMDDMR